MTHPAHDYQAVALDEWPRLTANGTAVEPVSGGVRILRQKRPPLFLDSSEARELGRAARNGDGDTLFAAAREADRQARMFSQLMERYGGEAS